MVSLSDYQLKTVMQTAADIDPAKRDIFLQRLGTMVELKGRVDGRDIAEFCKLASAGLIHHRNDAA
jgi:hypothetical protein